MGHQRQTLFFRILFFKFFIIIVTISQNPLSAPHSQKAFREKVNPPGKEGTRKILNKKKKVRNKMK